MTKREEIVDYTIKSGLLKRCCECQVAKTKSNIDTEYLDDLEQDMWVWLMTYDIKKLSNAYENGHLNALYSKVIINWLYSNTSPYHKIYRRYTANCDEITDEELNIPDE